MAGQDTHDLRRFVMRCPAVAAAFHHIIKRPLQLEVVFRALRIGLDPSAVHTCFIYPQAHWTHLHGSRPSARREKARPLDGSRIILARHAESPQEMLGRRRGYFCGARLLLLQLGEQ